LENQAGGILATGQEASRAEDGCCIHRRLIVLFSATPRSCCSWFRKNTRHGY